MGSGKFIPAMMHKYSVQTHKIKQEQYKSTYKYFQNKAANNKNKMDDIFVKTEAIEKLVSNKSIIKILTDKVLNTKIK